MYKNYRRYYDSYFTLPYTANQYKVHTFALFLSNIPKPILMMKERTWCKVKHRRPYISELHSNGNSGYTRARYCWPVPSAVTNVYFIHNATNNSVQIPKHRKWWRDAIQMIMLAEIIMGGVCNFAFGVCCAVCGRVLVFGTVLFQFYLFLV